MTRFIPNTARTKIVACAALALSASVAAAFAAATPAQKAVLDQYAALAKKADPNFRGFSPQRGHALFFNRHSGGKPATPNCITCHTTDLTKPGETRTGKKIEPMAASVSPKRYTDFANDEKWFRRNCNDVIGRECTVVEKGDILSFLQSL
jgi:cytochrome c553